MRSATQRQTTILNKTLPMHKPLLSFLLLFAYVSVIGACESPGQVADDSLDAETRALVED